MVTSAYDELLVPVLGSITAGGSMCVLNESSLCELSRRPCAYRRLSPSIATA